MKFLNIFLILSAVSSFSCQTKQKVRELSEPQELVSNDERKKQPERPDYAIKAPDFELRTCLLYTSPSPRDRSVSRMPSSA